MTSSVVIQQERQSSLTTDESPNDSAIEVVQSCSVNCGSRCALRFHIENDELRWVETDDGSEDDGSYQMRACLRGRAMRYWLNSADRLNHPLRRAGKRGSGEYVRITWDEALDEIAHQISRIVRTYGNEAVLIPYGTGIYTGGGSPFGRLMNCLGGYLGTYGDYSCAQLQTGMKATFGDDGYRTGSTLSTVSDADVVVLFGSNPCDTRMGGAGASYEFMRAKERGHFKLYSIDPRHTDVVSTDRDTWIPIKPGTDAALVAGIAFVLIREGFVDEEVLTTYCIGYDCSTLPKSAPLNGSYKDYILGAGPDGVAKTPQWASSITKVPERLIERLARDIGVADHAFIAQGWGPQRSEKGETTARSICMLSLLTGNLGLPGTNGGMRERYNPHIIPEAPYRENAVKTKIPAFMWLDAVERGGELTRLNAGIRGSEALSGPVKMIINHGGNCLTNQHADINRTHEVLVDEERCEFIVGVDVMMTDSMRYADIILPDLARAEAQNLVAGGNADMQCGLIRGQDWNHETYDRKGSWEMALGLAERLGVEDCFRAGLPGDLDTAAVRLEEASTGVPTDVARRTYDLPSDIELPTLEHLDQCGVWRRPLADSKVAYEDFRRDPDAYPLNTPSGKIEIYSEETAKLSEELERETGETIPALPVYVPAAEEEDNAYVEQWPFQLIGFHGRQSTHSSFANVEELQALTPRELLMNPLDAEAVGVVQGELVVAENQRGSIVCRLRVTPRIMPGVVGLPQGGWHSADMEGSRLDLGGCVNTLTSGNPTSWAHANPHNTCRVLVRPLGQKELSEMMERG